VDPAGVKVSFCCPLPVKVRTHAQTKTYREALYRKSIFSVSTVKVWTYRKHTGLIHQHTTPAHHLLKMPYHPHDIIPIELHIVLH